MRFAYPALLRPAGDEIIVSFRDLPECLTCGDDQAEALAEAQDALAVTVACRISDGDPIPAPSDARPGEHLVAVPADMAAKAAFALAFRRSGLTLAALAARLDIDEKSVQRMLDPSYGTDAGRIHAALRALEADLVLELR